MWGEMVMNRRAEAVERIAAEGVLFQCRFEGEECGVVECVRSRCGDSDSEDSVCAVAGAEFGV